MSFESKLMRTIAYYDLSAQLGLGRGLASCQDINNR